MDEPAWDELHHEDHTEDTVRADDGTGNDTQQRANHLVLGQCEALPQYHYPSREGGGPVRPQAGRSYKDQSLIP